MPECRGNHYAIYDEHHVHSRRDQLGKSVAVVERTERRFSLRVHYKDLWYEAVVVPKERFITYEPSDFEWLWWCGKARIERLPIRPGERFNAQRLTGEDVVIYVTKCRLELFGDYAEVEGFQVDEDTKVEERLAGFYVR